MEDSLSINDSKSKVTLVKNFTMDKSCNMFNNWNYWRVRIIGFEISFNYRWWIRLLASVVTVGSGILQDVSCVGQLNSPVKSQEEDVQSCVITIITSCTLHERHPSFVQVLNDPTQHSHTCTFFSQHLGQWWKIIVCVLGHHSSFSLLVNGLSTTCCIDLH